MVSTVGYQDPHRLDLIGYLKNESRANDAPIWARIAEELSRSRKIRVEVNLEKLNKFTKPKDTVIVAGKILGSGTLDHEVTVASFKASKSASDKIVQARGRLISIRDLVKMNPKGANIKIIK
jgi:large subunit ribosomal protein L18e